MVEIFEYNKNKITESCFAALKKLNMKLYLMDLQENIDILKITTEKTLLSYGEIIEIRIIFIEDTKTEFYVQSVCKSQLIGWGKNIRNKKNIIKEIKNILRSEI